MKKYLLRPAVLVLCSVFILIGFVTIADKTTAQETDSSLSTQIDRMAEQIGKLAEALTLKSTSTEDIAPMEVSLQTTVNIPNPSCLSNYTSWPKSRIRKSAPWDMAFIPQGSYPSDSPKQFIDVNGDGLVDYLYQYKTSTGTTGTSRIYDADNNLISSMQIESDCLYLNTGTGWEEAYKCVSNRVSADNDPNDYYNDYQAWFYGDCADI